MPNGLSRRQFLTLLSGAGVAHWTPRSVAQRQDRSSVIIIGAGIAGLAAARQLVNGGHLVTILEARDRIGGRIWTDRTLGLPIDLGAAWIHGVEGNPITQLAAQFDLSTVTTPYEPIAVYDGKNRFSESEYEAAYERYTQVQTFLQQQKTSRSAANLSVSEALRSRLTTATPLDRFVKWLVNSSVYLDRGSNGDDLGVAALNEDSQFDGEDVIFPNGYEGIINGLARNLTIQTGQIVTAIDYTSTPIRVTTEKGTFEADRVIITLPLGVLKSGKVQFTPALPAEKTGAISRLGMGVLDKIVMRFPRTFWVNNVTRIGRTESEIEYVNIGQFLSTPVLIGLLAGNFARQLEQGTTQAAVDRAMGDLKAIYGATIPDPLSATFTRWHGDPFTGGSYSLVPPGARQQDYDQLAEPVSGKLYFAGEATESRYPATVHGAYLSGLREASRIMLG
jgi:monoamine oxidase